MAVIETTEYMVYVGLRNGMSLRQIRQRIPVLAAQKLGITVAQFHQRLGEAFGPGEEVINSLVERVISKFTPAERRAISLRK